MNPPIIVFHYAGGTRYSLQSIGKFLPESNDFILVEYPGRGMRMEEDLLTSMEQLADCIYEEYRSLFASSPILFGHCMGGLLAYLVAKRACAEGSGLPSGLLVSGCPGPSRITNAHTHLLADPEFRQILPLFNISPVLLENESYYEMIAPIMRADLQAYNEYVHEPGEAMNIPVCLVLEKDDPVSKEDLESWQTETLFPLKANRLKGTVEESPAELADLLARGVGEEHFFTNF